MKTSHLIILFALCVIAFVTMTLHDQQHLPAQVASHFDFSGQADGTMSRRSLLAFTVLAGPGSSLLLIAIFYLIRYFPPSLLNVPNESYWRAPKNYPRACDIIFRSGLWLASGLLLWTTAFFHLIARANTITPPQLDGLPLALLSICFIAFISLWCLLLFQNFRKIPSPDSPQK